MAVSDRTEPRVELRDDVPPPWVGQRMTLDEFLTLPEVKPYLEYTDGLVTQKMAAKPDTRQRPAAAGDAVQSGGRSSRAWRGLLRDSFCDPWVGTGPRCVVLPTRTDQMARATPSRADFFEPPDIAIEIVSPDQSVTEQIKKCLRYIALGSQVALVIDPDPETVSCSARGSRCSCCKATTASTLTTCCRAFRHRPRHVRRPGTRVVGRRASGRDRARRIESTVAASGGRAPETRLLLLRPRRPSLGAGA